MTEDLMLHGYRGHSHHRRSYPTPVIELDGNLVTVGVDDDAVLWTCDLRGGECVNRPLDVDAAGPDDDWYVENGYWDEEEDDEFPPERITVEPYNIASRLTVAHLDGHPIVVTGGERYDFSFDDDPDSSGGIVRAWDLRTGRRIGKVMIGHVLAVCSLTTVPYERGLLSVSSCESGKLLAWDLASGERVAELQGSYNGEMGASLIDGRPVAATGGHDDFIQVWDLLSGEQTGQLTGIEPAVGPIAITTIEDRAVVVAAGGDNMLHVWDLATQERIGSPLTGHADRIETVDTATVGGRTIAVTGSYDDRSGDSATRLWDLGRGEQIGDPIVGHQLQTVTQIAGAPVAVTAGADEAIRLWDLTLAAR